MFAPWQTVFQLLGSAAASLVGLLFVVASFTTRREGQDVSRGVRLFLSPTVFHLAMVLAFAALALAPASFPGTAVMVALAAWTLVYSAGVMIGVLRFEGRAHASDIYWYAIGPMLLSVGLAAAAALAWSGDSRGAAGLAALLIGLLGVAIRNAWDLVTWLALRR